MLSIRVASIVILFLGGCAAVAVLPRPVLNIEDVTSYSITVNWTIPKNELYSEFVVSIKPEEGNVADYNPMDMRRTFTDLTPGRLYEFEVRTVREESFSDPSVILQDTIPLSPNNLRLKYFNTLVLTMEGPYFLNTEFTVETSGIEAEWEKAAEGVSDCFEINLSPNDGSQAIAQEKEEEDVESRLRQFINLVPGKVYLVTVATATCGKGHRGKLLSDFIKAEIKLPPANPPVIKVQEVTTTTAELNWNTEPIDGFYDDFEVVSTDTDQIITVSVPSNPKDLGRNITGLEPCTTYNLNVFTLLEGEKSESPQKVVIDTKPKAVRNIIVQDFTDSSLSLSWEKSHDSISYIVELSPSSRSFEVKDNTITLEKLKPGVRYSIRVYSVCNNEAKTKSKATVTTQTTKPSPPGPVTSECTFVGREPVVNDPYDQVPWEAPEPSQMSLAWKQPSNGSWDGFLVHYSPFEFEQGLSSPASPMLLGPRTTNTQITVPVAGRVITVTIRTLSDNIASEPLVQKIMCGNELRESYLRCRSWLLYWNIIITPIEENTKLLVEIPDFPIYNATINIGFQEFPFYNNTFVINNPCPNPTARITVYPRCPENLPFCPVIIRRLCVNRGTFKDVTPDACCHNKLYNSNEEVCCHNKLVNLRTRGTEECCVSRWYDRKNQRCCKSISETAKVHTGKSC